jgi:predicted dinucleotide-binding enzyme
LPLRSALLYVSEDDRERNEFEHLIRTAGFEALRIGEIGHSSRLEVVGDLHDLVVGPKDAQSLVVEA